MTDERFFPRKFPNSWFLLTLWKLHYDLVCELFYETAVFMKLLVFSKKSLIFFPDFSIKITVSIPDVQILVLISVIVFNVSGLCQCPRFLVEVRWLSQIIEFVLVKWRTVHLLQFFKTTTSNSSHWRSIDLWQVAFSWLVSTFWKYCMCIYTKYPVTTIHLTYYLKRQLVDLLRSIFALLQ